jgi:ribosomal-protein-alanine N-acetyltransferase
MATGIRPYRDDDFETVMAIERGEDGSDYQSAVFVRQSGVLFPQTFFVLEHEGTAAGFTVGGGVQGDGGRAWVLRLKVRADLRGRGFGRRLLSHLLDALHERGVAEILLSVSPNNIPAVRLYESSGFDVAGKEERYFGDGEDRLVMRLPLPQ